jgi:hypothetical protein
MNSNDELYEKALKITQSNEALYDRWENQIASYMSKIWAEAFSEATDVSGSEYPTVMEVADMASDKIASHDEFLSDLQKVFNSLAKGNQLDSDGNWS